jgi:hypothetical protein
MKEVNKSPRRTKPSFTTEFPVFLHDGVTLYFSPAPTQLAKVNQLFKQSKTMVSYVFELPK